MKTISILTICPEMFESFHKDHVIDRAVLSGELDLRIVDIRTYARGCFRKVDDSPYGGGFGMIMRIQPVMDAVEEIKGVDPEAFVIALAPIGTPYTQQKAHELLQYSHIVLICGHYEGMDARIYDHVDMILSVGDFVLSGGEIAAMAVADSLARLLPNVLKPGSLQEESFSDGRLEYPQYTRPSVYRGQAVPEVLLSGNHEAIKAWRKARSEEMTRKYRPDLMDIYT